MEKRSKKEIRHKPKKKRGRGEFDVQKFVLSKIKDYAYTFAYMQGAGVLYRPFLDWFFEEEKVSYSQKYYVKKVLDKMIKEKLAKLENGGRLELTKTGEKKLSDLEFSSFRIAKPEKWDDKFRVIIFDIVVEKNRTRAAVRRQLINWGFIRLQNSVWVHPYDCQEVIGLLKKHFEATKDIVYMVVEFIEGADQLKKEFGLV